MCKRICITNRHLVKDDFFRQIELVLATRPWALILREKDLSQTEYEELAVKVLSLSKEAKVPCYLNGRPELVKRLGANGVQLSFEAFMHLSPLTKRELPSVGVSVHCREEALQAEAAGASYVIYGHVFETQCKPDLEPRGLGALSSVCGSLQIPVYAIGGINDTNERFCLAAGASGVCMMSQFMKMEPLF